MPSSFTTPLWVTPLDDGRTWQLVNKFEYHIGQEDSGIEIRVPAGFITDFASIPRILWAIYPAWGKYGKAAVLHDWLYQTAALSRAMADAVLLEAMWVLGVPRWRRWAIYAPVRLFGWMFYPSKRRDIVEAKVEKEAEKRVEKIEGG